MNPEVIYLLKANIAIALFYAFYRLFFYKDTFFNSRRIVLLTLLVISFTYPLLDIQNWVKEQPPMVAMTNIYAETILPEVSIGAEHDQINWNNVITFAFRFIYLAVAALLLIRFFAQLIALIRLRSKTDITYIDGTKVRILPTSDTPFSFFKWIFIHPESHTEKELNEIITHEQTHARQWHSIDVIISELLCIACWYNPFIWLVKREIRNNLEYLADHKVLETGYDSASYQYHLLGLTCKRKVATLYNNFNFLPLKNRIRMMNKKRSKQIARTKYLVFPVLAALLLVVSNIDVIARTTERAIDKMVEAKAIATTERTPSVDQQEPVFEVVDKMPEYPGGNSALMQFLLKNIKYPENAVKNNKQGRVVVQFIVDKEGNVTEPRIVRGVDPELDAEALRIIPLMPKWVPGEQKGQKVNVRYTVPVMFRLPDSNINSTINTIKKEEIETPIIGKDGTYEMVEVMPEFPGGNKALMEFIQNNLKYPEEAKTSGTQGRVILQFVVKADGSIANPIIVRSVDPYLDSEALRIVKLMPKWKPGTQGGKPVDVRYTIPVMFRL